MSNIKKIRLGFLSIFVGIIFLIYQYEIEYGLFLGLIFLIIGLAFISRDRSS